MTRRRRGQHARTEAPVGAYAMSGRELAILLLAIVVVSALALVIGAGMGNGVAG